MRREMILTPVGLGFCLFLFVPFAFADDDRPGVSLLLTEVSAKRGTERTDFRCWVTLDNDTGRELKVKSNFFSAFDGMELVVTDAEGKVQRQQPYIFHQSPFTSDGREFVLSQGKTGKSLVFPVSSFGTVGQSLKVRLVGTLPGSTYHRILSTETMKVVIGDRK